MEPHRPETIAGYEAPVTANYSKNRIYKTFSEGQAAKKKENFGNTTHTQQYASVQMLSQEESCPECGQEPINFSNCVFNVKNCVNSHHWFTDRDGEVKSGQPKKKL